jgi:hypothetical protein
VANDNTPSDDSCPHEQYDQNCISCGEQEETSCPKSERECGHHCNHVWSHDKCCWCDAEFGDDDAAVKEAQAPVDERCGGSGFVIPDPSQQIGECCPGCDDCQPDDQPAPASESEADDADD